MESSIALYLRQDTTHAAIVDSPDQQECYVKISRCVLPDRLCHHKVHCVPECHSGRVQVGWVSAFGHETARVRLLFQRRAPHQRAAHLATACWSITPRCGSTRAHSMDRRKALQCASFASCMSSSYLHSSQYSNVQQQKVQVGLSITWPNKRCSLCPCNSTLDTAVGAEGCIHYAVCGRSRHLMLHTCSMCLGSSAAHCTCR